MVRGRIERFSENISIAKCIAKHGRPNCSSGFFQAKLMPGDEFDAVRSSVDSAIEFAMHRDWDEAKFYIFEAVKSAYSDFALEEHEKAQLDRLVVFFRGTLPYYRPYYDRLSSSCRDRSYNICYRSELILSPKVPDDFYIYDYEIPETYLMYAELLELGAIFAFLLRESPFLSKDHPLYNLQQIAIGRCGIPCHPFPIINLIDSNPF